MVSPVFESMFYGPLRDCGSKIVLQDDPPLAISLLLDYIYCGRVETDDMLKICQLYTLADKYLIDGLFQDCRKVS